MTSNHARRIGLALILVALGAISFVAPDPLLASTVQGEDIGRNLGDLLAGWAAAVFSGTVGLVALVFLLQRKLTELAIFLAAVVLVGGMIFAPDAVRGAVEGIWEAVAGRDSSGSR